MHPFDTSDVLEDSKIYQSRGQSEDEANAAAIEDHLAELRAEREAIVDKVIAEFEKRMPKKFAALVKAKEEEATARAAAEATAQEQPTTEEQNNGEEQQPPTITDTTTETPPVVTGEDQGPGVLAQEEQEAELGGEVSEPVVEPPTPKPDKNRQEAEAATRDLERVARTELAAQPEMLTAFKMADNADQFAEVAAKEVVRWIRKVYEKADLTELQRRAADRMVVDGKAVLGKDWYESLYKDLERAHKAAAAELKKQQGENITNTGEAIRRLFDGAKKQSDDAKDWNEIDQLTNRGQFFDALLTAKDLTPGARAMLENIRSKVYPFLQWAHSSSGPAKINNQYSDINSENIAQMMRRTEGTQQVRDAALAYVLRIQPLINKLQGATSVGLLNAALTELENSSSKNLVLGILRHSRITFLTAGTHSPFYEQENNQAYFDAQKKEAVRPPRIEKVVAKKDHRDGKDISAEAFKEKFGFVEVQFGEYVKAAEGQRHLNAAYDAFMDMAEHLGMPPKAVSLGGWLHFSIGALGFGKHAAHFEMRKDVAVINLTKTQGDGTVAHEWGHALDYRLRQLAQIGTAQVEPIAQLVGELRHGYDYDDLYAAAIRGLKGEGWMRGSKDKLNTDEGRIENAIALVRYYQRRQTSKYHKNALKMDGTNTVGKNAYWSNKEEMFARAWEAYMLDTLGGVSNYLVNPEFVGEGIITERNYRGTPYSEGDERQRHNKMFAGFVKAINWSESGEPSIDKAKAAAAVKETADSFEKVMARLRDDMKDMLVTIKEEQASKKSAEAQAAAEAIRMKPGMWVRERAGGSTALVVKIASIHETVFRNGPVPILRLELSDGSTFDRYATEYTIVPDPEVAQAEIKEDLTAELSADDIEAAFDEAAAELDESKQEKPDAPSPGEPSATTKLTAEDAAFLLEKIEKGQKVLLAATEFGLPTIHGIQGARHIGYGVFQVDTGAYKITFDAGTMMQSTPGGQHYTIASVERGEFPYDKDKYVATLKGLLLTTGGRGAKLPDVASQTEKTAGAIAKEAAKLGVTGINESLAGLVELFGGNRIKSFPSGFDEESYKKAKPHFIKALDAFQKAGKTLKDLFKFLIEQFGMGIKPYAVRFAKDMGLTTGLGQQVSPAMKIANWVQQRVHDSEAFKGPDLWKVADAAFGGTVSEGKYTTKDAYDAMEAGMNRYIIAQGETFNTMGLEVVRAQLRLTDLQAKLDKLATQSVRTDETDALQQFSTPPNYSFVANWVANLRETDVYLEPSAGVGGLASFGYAAGLPVIVNELSSRRAAILAEVLPGARMFNENAEQLHNILPDDVKPTVVVMNPPFSATVRGGANNSMNGADHIEQALKRLVNGGRLVAITGEGMAADRPAFKTWWARIAKEYNVRANVGVNGDNYRKYGTTFDNQILVIDKSGPTTGEIVTGKFNDLADVIAALEGVKNDRPQADQVAEPETDQPDGGGKTPPGVGDQGSTGDTGTSPPGVGGGGRGGSGKGGGTGTGGSTAKPPRGTGTGKGNGLPGGGRGGRGSADTGTTTGPADAQGGNTGADEFAGNTDSEGSGVDLEKAEKINRGEISDSIYENYVPAKLNIPGALPHPGLLVESSAMAAVEPPDPTYKPNLPKEVITEGRLSLPQLEVVVYAGQAHEQFLDNGDRRGFFIGDGTGVGKGREIAGIIYDNVRQGRKKHVWLSEKPSLFADAKRDYQGVTGSSDSLFYIPDAKATIDQKEGILYLPYSTLRVGMATSTNAPSTFRRDVDFVKTLKPGDRAYIANFGFAGKESVRDHLVEIIRFTNKDRWTGKDAQIPIADVRVVDGPDKGKSAPDVAISFGKTWELHHPSKKVDKSKPQARIDQVAKWLGPDFDGVIAFDESHNMGNTGIGETGGQGSQQAAAGLALQERFPKARIVYISATGATEVRNLTYANRLGMWGGGTPFAGPLEFIGEILKGGVAALELVAQNLKATGSYLARNLSFEGVEHQRLEHKLNDDQRTIYNELAKAWQIVLQNMEAALTTTGADKAKGAKGRMRGMFWSTQQRFFNQIITSMQMPTAIDKAKAQLAAGEAVVFQMVSTNEAAQSRAVVKAEQEETPLEELDFTPKESLIEMIRGAYPVMQYEEVTDAEGRVTMVLVLDSQGNPVENKEAVAARDALIENIDKHLKVPDNPLDMIIQEFGPDAVAEISGRSSRYTKREKEDGGFELVKQIRSGKIADAEAAEFMADKRRVLVFTGAGSTGRSFHSDKGVANQRRRAHFVVQPGWRADQTTQGFGRTHRSNEANQPTYFLVTTDITAQKRFITSIARRLDQLGALTKGQRETGSQGMFNAADNLEGPYSHGALRGLLEDIINGRSPFGREVLTEMGLDDVVKRDDPTALVESRVPDVPKFLNRLLSLTLERQNEVFDEFFNRIDAGVEAARAAGTLDKGIETVRALSVKKLRDEVVYTDKRTQAKARFLELELVQPTIINKWADAQEEERDADSRGYFIRPSDGRIFVVVSRGTKVDARGRTYTTGYMLGVKNKRVWTDAVQTIEDGVKGANPKPAWRKATDAEAKKTWDAELADTPTTHVEKMHLLSGALLGIWDRIDGDPKIKRIATSDGERFIGRELRGKALSATMHNLQIGSSLSKMTPAEMMAEILSGKAAKLANGWRITRSRVRSEDRLEVTPGAGYMTQGEQDLMRQQGLISEKIDFKTRFFIPTGNVEVFTRFTSNKPVTDLFDPSKGKADDDLPANIRKVPIDAIYAEMERMEMEGADYKTYRADVAARLREMLLKNEVTPENVAKVLADLDRSRAARVIKSLSFSGERVRGRDYIMQRLYQAVREGDITDEDRAFTEWLIDKNPDMVENLGISIKLSKKDKGVAGRYDDIRRVVRLFKEVENGTAVHEILHHTERMLPRVVREGIIGTWARELALATENATPEDMTVIEAILAANQGKTNDLRKLVEDGKFPYRLYHLVNPSEYWAVNGSEILADRFATPRWRRLAYQWYQELVAFLRGSFGLRNNFPVMRGLRAILKTDGTETSNVMLHEAGANQDIRRAPSSSFVETTIDGLPALSNVYVHLMTPESLGPDRYSWRLYSNDLTDEAGDPLYLGFLIADYKGGKFTALQNIEIENGLQGQGVGETVVASMLRHNEGTQMRVLDIQHAKHRGTKQDPLPFWKKLGTVITNFSSDPSIPMDGVLTLKAYNDSRASRNQETSRDALVEDAQPESGGTRQAEGGRAASEGTEDEEVGSFFNIVRNQEPSLFGGGRRLVDDMWSVTRKFVHPRMVASRRAGVAKIFDIADQQDQRAKEIVEELSQMYQPQLEKLSDDQKDALFGVLERGRLYGMFYKGGRGGPVVAEDPNHIADIMPGETITLDSEEEKSAYFAARRAMNRALDLYREQFIEDAGFDPAVITKATDVMALMTTKISEIEGKRLERLAMALVEIEQAKRRGYIPFNRFGEVGIWVRMPDEENEGETKIVHFEGVELGIASRAKNMLPLALRPTMGEYPEVATRVEALRAQYPDAEIGVSDRTRLKPQDKVDLAGVNGLAGVSDVDPATWDAVYQQLLEATKKKGFRRHLLGSEHVPGYSPDFERGLADYVVGLGGFLARRRFAKKAEDAISKIEATNEHAYAENYWKYVNKPGQELARMRQITFLYYIVGGVGSAVTNASQPTMVTLPYLSQFMNPARVTGHLTRAYAEALQMLTVTDWKDVSQLRKSPQMFDPHKAPADVREVLLAEWGKGAFVPLNVNDVIAVAHETGKFRRGVGKKVDTAIEDLAILFSGAERLNRLVSFIAAYRIAGAAGVREKVERVLAGNELAKRQLFGAGGMDQEKFAKWTVDETQYVMGKLNRPEAFRGVGTAIFQFMGFTVQTIELMWRMGLQNSPRGKAALGLMLALLFAAAGLWGLPGADNLRDILEWAYKKWGKLDLDIKTLVYEAVYRITGSRQITDAVAKGALSNATGIDWSFRLGLGDILKTKSTGDTPIDWEKMAGVNYDMWVKRPMRALAAVERGDTTAAVAAALPNFLGNPLTSMAWQESGIRSAKSGNVVIPAEQITKGQAALKVLGFTPLDIAMRRERVFAQERAKHSPEALRGDFYTRMARAEASKERATQAGNLGIIPVIDARIANIEKEIDLHNATHPPHEMIRLSPQTLRAKVQTELAGEASRKTPKLARERVEQLEQVYGR